MIGLTLTPQWCADKLQAVWGYHSDEDGIAVVNRRGEEVDFFGIHNLPAVLQLYGRYGVYHLVFRHDTWKAIPALDTLRKAYEAIPEP